MTIPYARNLGAMESPLLGDVDEACRRELRQAAATHLLRGADVGVQTHAAIVTAALCSPGPRFRPTAAAVRRIARSAAGRGDSPSARQAHRSAVGSLASVYVERLWPSNSRLIAAELIVRDARFDLLFALDDGRIVGDEIKTGLFVGAQEATIVAQVARQAEAAAAAWERFAGVRVACVRFPARSFFVDATGSVVTWSRAPAPMRLSSVTPAVVSRYGS